MIAPPLVPPAYQSLPPRMSSAGEDAVDLAATAGRHLDATQRYAVDAILSEGPDGKWASLEAALICCRQNLKTYTFEAVILAKLFLFQSPLVIWSAHLFETAQESFRHFDEMVTNYDHLRRRVKTISRANGEEGIELVNGCRLKFRARSKSGGRGLTGSAVVLDEAFALQPGHMGALLPTLSAQPNPHVLYGSSAGLPESAVLRGIRDRGRAADGSLVYLEWCAPEGGCQLHQCDHSFGRPGCALDDEANWLAANPALDVRISRAYVRSERRAMPPEEFARERLGWWDEPGGDQRITLDAWTSTERVLPERPPGRPAFFIDCSPSLRSAAIASAVRLDDGTPYVELADYERGTEWVVARARELRDRYLDAVWAVDASGGASALLPDLARAGIEPELFSRPDMGRACGHLERLVREAALAHAPDDPDNPLLATALGGAVPLDIGDGLWVWGRRKSSTDICPLIAETGALWLLEQRPPTTEPLVAWG